MSAPDTSVYAKLPWDNPLGTRLVVDASATECQGQLVSGVYERAAPYLPPRTSGG